MKKEKIINTIIEAIEDKETKSALHAYLVDALCDLITDRIKNKCEEGRLIDVAIRNKFNKMIKEKMKMIKEEMDDIKVRLCKFKEQILKKELSETENRINELERFKTYTLGLWATDRPDKIPENIKDLFFEIEE